MLVHIPKQAGKVQGLRSSNKYWHDDLTDPLDIAIKDVGFHVWSIDNKIVPYKAESQANAEWENLGAYMGTLQVLFDFHYNRKKKPASPAQYIDILSKIPDLGKRYSYVCLFEIEGEGMGRSGYGALVSSQKHPQRSMISISCGDGWGEDCMFAVVPE